MIFDETKNHMTKPLIHEANDPTSGDASMEMLSRSTFLRMSKIFNDGSETQFRTLSSLIYLVTQQRYQAELTQN